MALLPTRRAIAFSENRGSERTIVVGQSSLMICILFFKLWTTAVTGVRILKLAFAQSMVAKLLLLSGIND
jgi:type IV secretory pathway TrbD component